MTPCVDQKGSRRPWRPQRSIRIWPDPHLQCLTILHLILGEGRESLPRSLFSCSKESDVLQIAAAELVGLINSQVRVSFPTWFKTEVLGKEFWGWGWGSCKDLQKKSGGAGRDHLNRDTSTPLTVILYLNYRNIAPTSSMTLLFFLVQKNAASLLGSRTSFTICIAIRALPSGAPGLHALLNYFGINFRFDYTYTYTLHCLGINYKSVIGAFLDYTYTPEITLTLLNCFQINFPKIHLHLHFY